MKTKKKSVANHTGTFVVAIASSNLLVEVKWIFGYYGYFGRNPSFQNYKSTKTTSDKYTGNY